MDILLNISLNIQYIFFITSKTYIAMINVKPTFSIQKMKYVTEKKMRIVNMLPYNSFGN